MSSKTNERNIFATNVTLDLVYVDPLITSDPHMVARTLSSILLTPDIHLACSKGQETCPRELITFYQAAFDPVTKHKLLESAALLEPLPEGEIPPSLLKLPDISGARAAFSEYIERRISEKRVTFSPRISREHPLAHQRHHLTIPFAVLPFFQSSGVCTQTPPLHRTLWDS